MNCDTRKLENVCLLRIEGELDHNSAKPFEDALLGQLDGCLDGKGRLVLDLSGVAFITSAALRVLSVAAKRCRDTRGDVVVAAMQPTVREIFKISRFDTIFKTYDTVRAALDEISPTAAAQYDGV